MTRRKVVQRVAPSVAAAASYLGSAERSAPSMAITTKGIDTKTCASTTPYVVKGKAKPGPVEQGLADDAGAAEGAAQRDAGDDRRQHQRHGDQRAHGAAAAEVDARQQPGEGQPEQQAEHDRHRRGDQREPERVERGARREVVRQRLPVGARDHRHERDEQEQRGEDRRHHQQRRRPAEPVPHGLPKPASREDRLPSSDVTHATQSAARSASSDCSSVATK